jgi:L-asparaginase/Glu-tRNA(Gln) amidotransferase subunit D
VITGAQIPLSQLRNDAFDNFLGALWIAGHYTIPGELRLANESDFELHPV